MLTMTLIVLLASSYGFGFAIMKWGIHDETNYLALLAGIGVSGLVVLGGILNFAGIAYPTTLFSLLLLGLVFFLLSLFYRFRMQPQLIRPFLSDDFTKTNLLDHLLPLLVLAIPVIYFYFTILPSKVFNYSDDFTGYIPRVERMLQTGTLAGNPYEMLGQDSLGAQSFLQGFFLLKLPIEYLPGFDAIFCFGLAGLLLIATARKFQLGWVYTIPSVLTFLVINPESVNVSALYSGSFAILSLLLTSCLLTDRLKISELTKPVAIAALVGLIISFLVALKTTLAVFAVIYFAIFYLNLIVSMQNKRRALLLSVITALTAAIAILPWLLLSLPNYLAAISKHLAQLNASSNPTSESFLFKANIGNLFSTSDLFWGGSLLTYGVIVILLIILGVISVFFMLRQTSHVKQKGYSLVATSACAAAVGTYFIDGMMFNIEDSVRYACPVLIAALPFALQVSSYNAVTSFTRSDAKSFARIALNILILGGSALILILFGSDFLSRAELAYNKRTTISFPINDNDIQYTHFVLSENARHIIRNIQYLTEPKEKILAWISMPLNLDFSRNEIQNWMDTSLLNPWLDFPRTDNPIDIAHYFKSQGVRYLLFEYQGGAMKSSAYYEGMLLSPHKMTRRMGENNLYMREMLLSIMKGGIFLYNQHGIALFDLDQIN